MLARMSDVDILRFFKYDHLPEKLQTISKPFGDLARHLATTLAPSRELDKALDRLLESKDAAVRAAL